jgi:HEPN domain-containing protein
MKTNADVARGWLRNARSDLLAMGRTLLPGTLEACCFHAQQAAEKALKGFLVARDRDFPFTHDLEKLVEIASAEDSSFLGLMESAKVLTPYAVELRYDQGRRVTSEGAGAACKMARHIVRFVRNRIPTGSRGARSV